MYRRVWEYLGSFLRNPPDLEGWESFSEVKKIGRSKIKKEMLFCRRILNQETSSTQYTPSNQNRESIIGKRPDIAHIAQILREQNEQQRKWKKEENFYLPLSEIHLEGTNLYKVHLERADLSSDRLAGAKLWQVRLEGTDLSDVQLDSTDLTSTDLSKVKNLTPQQFIGKECRYRKANPPLLPEEWSQEQREQVLASMKVYGE